MQYRLIKTISGKGSAPHEFTTVLRALAVDRDGFIHAVGDREVKVFDAAVHFVRRWTTTKPGYCLFLEQAPGGSHAWVGESGVVETFDAAGQTIGELRDPNRLGTVTAVAVRGDDVLLADATARCIRRYGRSGRWLNDIGRDNNTQGFLIPNGYLDFRLDAAGVIHACNPAKHRIERYSLAGELLGHFGRFGHRPENFTGCCNPTNLHLLPDNRIAVTEKAPPRMKVYDANGAVLAAIGPKEFDLNCKNMGLAGDADGRVYVADTERLHILVFALDSPGATTAPAATASASAREDTP